MFIIFYFKIADEKKGSNQKNQITKLEELRDSNLATIIELKRKVHDLTIELKVKYFRIDSVN